MALTSALLVGSAAVLVGGTATAATAIGGALLYKYKKMEKRKLSKLATAGLFGSLLDTIDPKYMDETTGIPFVVESIFSQIESSGMYTKGIFHKPGNISRIKELSLLFEENKRDELELFSEDTHNLCGVAVYYIQRLPEPLCTLLLYQDFLNCHETLCGDDEKWITKMKELLLLLPELNRRLLCRIVQFFSMVGENSDNTISSDYLAYMLGPLLFYDHEEGEEHEGEAHLLKYDKEIVFGMLMKMFEQNQRLFPVPLKELPPWKNSRKKDTERRQSTSLDNFEEMIINEQEETKGEAEVKQETEEEITEKPEEDLPPKKKPKRSKLLSQVTFGLFKPRYKGELEQAPPPNTISVNYTYPPLQDARLGSSTEG